MDTNYFNLFRKHMCTLWAIHGYHPRDYLINFFLVEDISRVFSILYGIRLISRIQLESVKHTEGY